MSKTTIDIVDDSKTTFEENFKLVKPYLNEKLQMDGLDLLKKIPDNFISAVFFDPQHREILDRQKYGNEGERQKGRYALPQMTTETIQDFMVEIERVLKPYGHLFLWIDKYLLIGEGFKEWLHYNKKLHRVSGLSWIKRMGMGARFRTCTEFLVVIQKEPVRSKGYWNDKAMRDYWFEKVKREKKFPHLKPIKLLARTMKCCTNEGDIILDPCAGSYSTLYACQLSARNFIGCDILAP